VQQILGHPFLATAALWFTYPGSGRQEQMDSLGKILTGIARRDADAS
jgi:hypothetical protein